jgi:hypothetical protein
MSLASAPRWQANPPTLVRLGSRVRIPSPAPINPKEIQGLSAPREKPGEQQNTEHNRKLHANCAEVRAKSAQSRSRLVRDATLSSGEARG